MTALILLISMNLGVIHFNPRPIVSGTVPPVKVSCHQCGFPSKQ